MNKTLDYYMGLPYNYSIYPAEEGGYVIEIPDLPGCITQGETAEEALTMIEDAKRCWIEVALEDGRQIPEHGISGSWLIIHCIDIFQTLTMRSYSISPFF